MRQVKVLSGGECNRLLLARLFAQPSNLLVMDEPTNDLDIETLELLEAMLASYKGTLLLVSHDRKFLDNVITSTLVFEGNGTVQEYIGGYQDWLLHRKKVAAQKKDEKKKVTTEAAVPMTAKRKLSFKEQNELKEMPKRIEKLEKNIEVLKAWCVEAGFYQQPQEKINASLAELHDLQLELEKTYERWTELER